MAVSCKRVNCLRVKEKSAAIACVADSQGRTPSQEADLQQDAAARRGEVDTSSLGARGRLQSIHWPQNSKSSKGVWGKAGMRKENPKEKLQGVSTL